MELLADQARVHWSVQSGAIVLRAEERYMVDIPAVQGMPEAVQGMLSSAGAKDVQFDAALLHGSAVRRQIARRSAVHAMRVYAGRPSSSIRLRARAAVAASVDRRSSVRDRSPSPMTRFQRDTSASAKARQL